MSLDILSLIIGAVLGALVSWFFYLLPKEEKWDEDFVMDKQQLNRYLEKVSFELKLIIEFINENEKINDKFKIENLLYFRRLIHEDPFTLTFGNKNIKSEKLKPVREARDLIEHIKFYIELGEFDKNKIKRYQSDITKLRLAIISISL
jgi:hypothetical protein